MSYFWKAGRDGNALLYQDGSLSKFLNLTEITMSLAMQKVRNLYVTAFQLLGSVFRGQNQHSLG